MWWKKRYNHNHRGVGAASPPRPVLWLLLIAAGTPLLRLQGQTAPTPAPPRPWQYIIIHHSATRTGNADEFDAGHRARGMINGLAYHFVINNGTADRPDGHIEVGDRWVKQMHGGHCRQAHINDRGIGICLVGDFTRDQPTAKQLDALVLLIRGLQYQFKIPDDNILGHGEVIGEFSECPGRQFPWEQLQERLRKK